MCNEYIPFQRMTGDGGLHLFIELEEKFMLVRFYKSVMSKGYFLLEMFYSNGEGINTFRLGFSRLKEEEIVRGIKIIGDTIKNEIWS